MVIIFYISEHKDSVKSRKKITFKTAERHLDITFGQFF